MKPSDQKTQEMSELKDSDDGGDGGQDPRNAKLSTDSKRRLPVEFHHIVCDYLCCFPHSQLTVSTKFLPQTFLPQTRVKVYRPASLF